MLSIFFEMLVLGTNWKTWFFMVSEQTCKLDYEMNQIMWQTDESFDIPHSSCHVKRSIVMLVMLQNNAGWDCFKTRLCGRSWGLQIYCRWNIIACWEIISLFPDIRCVRSKPLFHRVQQNQKSSFRHSAFDSWDLIVLICGNNSELWYNGEIRRLQW